MIAAVIAAVILAPLGALVCGLINVGLSLAGTDLPPARILFSSSIVIPYPIRPLAVVSTLIGLIVLAAMVLLITLLVARAADRRRGFAAVFFGTWLAVIIGGWLATLAAWPANMADLRIPADMVGQMVLQRVSSAGGWGLYWGWITGLVCALIFTATNRRS